MDFLYKLFPFRSLFNLDGETLTAWWVLIIILVFTIYLIRVLLLTSKLKKRIRNFTRNFSEQEIEKDSYLSSIWKDYYESFIKWNGDEKTDDYSYEYFNEKNLMASNSNFKLINSIPNILVGLGILGTFVGLTYGISNFNTGTTEEIKNSIQVLLAGMGTAFISSIYGMFFSLLFTFLEKIQINSLHHSIHSLCYNLDRRFKISKNDERLIQVQNQKELLDEYFMFHDENQNKVKPGNLFRDLYSESKKQSFALQSFSTDLAEVIEAGFEKILNDPDKGVTHELQKLKDAIINLGSKLKDPASEMTQNVVKELERSMATMVEEFKISMSGSAKTELENLSTVLANAGEKLTSFPEQLEQMTQNLNSNFVNLQNVVDEISKKTMQESTESTMKMRGEIEELSKILTSKVGELQSGQEGLLNKQNENIQVSQNLLSAFNNSIENLNHLSNEVKGTLSSFSEVQSELSNASEKFKEISQNVLTSSNTMMSTQKGFSDQSDRFLNTNSKTIEEIQISLSRAKELSSDYSEKFQVIEKGLSSIFDQIHNGIEEYRDNVGESIETFLGKYTEALTTTAESLSGSSNRQSEILEELTEQLSRLQSEKVKA